MKKFRLSIFALAALPADALLAQNNLVGTLKIQPANAPVEAW